MADIIRLHCRGKTVMEFEWDKNYEVYMEVDTENLHLYLFNGAVNAIDIYDPSISKYITDSLNITHLEHITLDDCSECDKYDEIPNQMTVGLNRLDLSRVEREHGCKRGRVERVTSFTVFDKKAYNEKIRGRFADELREILKGNKFKDLRLKGNMALVDLCTTIVRTSAELNSEEG